MGAEYKVRGAGQPKQWGGQPHRQGSQLAQLAPPLYPQAQAAEALDARCPTRPAHTSAWRQGWMEAARALEEPWGCCSMVTVLRAWSCDTSSSTCVPQRGGSAGSSESTAGTGEQQQGSSSRGIRAGSAAASNESQEQQEMQ